MKQIDIANSDSLIATLGTEPQVVTVALDLLQWRGQTISYVTVLHTVAPGTPIEAAVETLRNEWSKTAADHEHATTLRLVPLIGSDGKPLSDIDTPEAAQAAFRVLYNEVRLAKISFQAVHLLIAGGRKTLTVYGMLAAQLLFDPNDRLWYLYSGGDFLASKRLHPHPGDDVHLVEIPVVQWSHVSPMLLDLADIEDPFAALEHQKQLHLKEQLDQQRAFVRGSLTPAEERVAAMLVREGLSDNEIAERLYLSPRTVEQHLRSAYYKAAAHWELESVSRTQLVALLGLYYTVEIPKLRENPDA